MSRRVDHVQYIGRSGTGLANLVVPADDLDAAARDLASAVLAGSRDAVIRFATYSYVRHGELPGASTLARLPLPSYQ